MKRIVILLMMALLTMVYYSCNRMAPHEKSLDEETADTPPSGPSLGAPRVTLDVMQNKLTLNFQGDLNSASGNVIIASNSYCCDLYKSGAAVKSGFTSVYKSSPGVGGTIEITGDPSAQFSSYTYIQISGFQDSAGNNFAPTNYYILNTTLTQSPTTCYDVDAKKFYITMPKKITGIGGIGMYVCYTNSGDTNFYPVSPNLSADQYSLIVDIELPDYPVFKLQNVIMEGGNSITYGELGLQKLPNPKIVSFGAIGVITVSMQNISGDKTVTPVSFTASNAIWDAQYLIGRMYLNQDLTIKNNNQTNLQKWNYWNINLSTSNTKHVEIYDGFCHDYIVGGTNYGLITNSNIIYNSGSISVPVDALNIGRDNGYYTRAYKIVARLFPGIGTNFIETNFQTVIDITNANSVRLNFRGLDVPWITYNDSVMPGYRLFTINYNNSISITDPMDYGLQALHITAGIDRLKVYEDIVTYGTSLKYKNENSLLINGMIDRTNYLYNNSLQESAWEHPSISMLDSARGIVSVRKLTTVDLSIAGVLTRNTNPSNLFVNYYNGSNISIGTIDNFYITNNFKINGYSIYDALNGSQGFFPLPNYELDKITVTYINSAHTQYAVSISDVTKFLNYYTYGYYDYRVRTFIFSKVLNYPSALNNPIYFHFEPTGYGGPAYRFYLHIYSINNTGTYVSEGTYYYGAY